MLPKSFRVKFADQSIRVLLDFMELFYLSTWYHFHDAKANSFFGVQIGLHTYTYEVMIADIFFLPR